MEILFIVSELLLILSFIFVKKTDKEIDIVNIACISIVLLFCYNTLICYVLTFFTIPCKLWLLSIINILNTAVLVIFMFKKKKFQKYIFNRIDIIYIFLLVIAIIAICYMNFGFPFDINYMSSDPSMHYLTSIRFAEQETLMPNTIPDEVYGTMDVRKPVSYVNSGLLMKCFCKNLDTIDCYNVFVAFGIFTLIMAGVTLYSALKKFAKNKECTLFAFLVALICTLGYPLNSFLFGFEYLTMGLLVLVVIIDIAIYFYEKEVLNIKWIILIMFLLNFGLFGSYYMFVPYVYSALWIYFCIKNYYKTKKIVTKSLILVLLITLIIPFVLGYIYHLAPNIYAILINKKIDSTEIWDYSNYIAGDGMAVDGYIYINLYSNIILLIPLTIYFFVKNGMDKKIKEELFICILIVFCVLFILILLLGNIFEKVSTYYLIKNYFALWIIFAFINYKALVTIQEENKYLSRVFIYSYIFLVIICTIFSEVDIIEKNTNEDENILSVMEIFGANKTILLYETAEYNKMELELLDYAKKNLDFDSRIELITTHRAYYWAYVLLGYTNENTEIEKEYSGQIELEKKWVDLRNKTYSIRDLDYVIYFNKTDLYKFLEDKLFKNGEIVYENESGGIIKYNK